MTRYDGKPRKTYAELEEELSDTYLAMYKVNAIANECKSECEELRAQLSARAQPAEALSDRAYIAEKIMAEFRAQPAEAVRVAALIDASGAFISDRLLEKMEDRPDDEPLYLEIRGRNGFVKSITLGDLRRLDKARDDALLSARAQPADAVRVAAQAVADDVCSYLCPSVKKTGTEWTHSEKCINLRRALTAAPSPDAPALREQFAAWMRQMTTPYADLPENEKESDRVEADKMLAIVTPRPARTRKKGE